jgi:cytidylate kinase
MGSLGNDVAQSLAAELGLQLVHEEIIDNLAEKMHTTSSAIKRVVQGNAGVIESLRADFEALALYSAEEVLNIALRGNLLIRGWGATYLLRPVSHVVCVRLCAPVDLRAQRTMARLKTDDLELAKQEVKRSDAANAAAMQRHFGIDSQDAMYYDLTLNTERLSIADCIEQIAALARRPTFQESAESLAQLQRMTLSAHVQAVLRNDHKTAHVRITVDHDKQSHAGGIVLRGIVVDEEERKYVAALAAQCAGVKTVDNQLRLMSESARMRVFKGV